VVNYELFIRYNYTFLGTYVKFGNNIAAMFPEKLFQYKCLRF